MGIKSNSMKKIKRALISVSNKTNLNDILKVLKKYKIKLISSGGTYKKIKNLGYECLEISKFTNSPEMLSGRLKTLHPKIHAGILSKRNNKIHNKEMKMNNFEEIDLVIVNFYPFEEAIKNIKNQKKIIENIDIGGPTMARAAAKNYNDVAVITNIDQYKSLISELNKNNGKTNINFRQKLSEKAFSETAYYDSVITNYFNSKTNNIFPEKKLFYGKLVDNLRYGENPHQKSSLYSTKDGLKIEQLHGKNLSYNNYNDIFSALSISKTLPKNIGTVIVKHANPCGVSIHNDNFKSYKLALACDPISAFGGIVSCNFKIKKKLAIELNKIFLEVIIANGFENSALKILKKKKNLRIIDASKLNLENHNNIISFCDSFLLQTPDNKKISKNNFTIVSEKKPNLETFNNLVFAFNVCRNVKSNGIVLTKNNSTIGIGSGQPSRLDSCRIAIKKMNKFQNIKDNDQIIAASDAFFPFVDGIEELIQAGVSAIIQPCGSIRDKEIISFANKTGTILVFSKTRHFKH